VQPEAAMPANSSDSPLVSPVSLADLTGRVRTGEQRLQDVVNEACDRIELLDLQVRAVLPEAGRRERLLAEAKQLAARYPDRDSRPPLYGVLIGVKDIIAVDGFDTRAGSALPPEVFEMPEAPAITRCREAGALILGKTVTTEFAMREPGSTANPHNLGHTPGGSSSGSAAGLAAGYFSLAFGTQTVGSVLRPAAFCGVVGYKPSYERISRNGVVAYSRSVDHVGMFTADAASMRRAAAVVCDDWDPAASSDIDGDPDATPTIGVTEGLYLEQATPEGTAAMERALQRMEAAGARVVRFQMFNNIAVLAARHQALIAAEFAEAHSERWPRYAWLYRPWSATHVEEGQRVPPEVAEEARHSRLELRSRLTELMNEHGLDLLASVPALGAAPFGLGATGDPAMNLPWTHSGLPAVSLPAGTNEAGLPLGIQLAARFEEDERLLAWSERL
jgi:Asp-tRNA(Asn)/Glu-tRNA(Gln) amidotransferase A subunit family amidase